MLVALVFLGVAFSGCAGDEQGPSKQIARRAPRQIASANLSAIEERVGQRLDAASGEPTVLDWFVLEASAAPDGNLSGFRMPLPLGSVIGMRSFGGSGVVMEVAPIVVGDAAIKEWCLVAFREDDLQATLPGLRYGSGDYERPERDWGVYCSFTEKRLVRDPLSGGDNATDSPPSTRPVYVSIEDRALEDLQNFYFVAAATSDAPIPFGLAIRFLQQYPSGFYPGTTNPAAQPAASLDVFLAERGALKPKALAKTGHGTGFSVGLWQSNRGLSPTRNTTLGSYESQAGAIEPPSKVLDGHPAAAVWNFNLSSPHPTAEGWSFVFGSYTSYCGTGRYAASANLHGQQFLSRSVIAQHTICGAIYGSIPQTLLFGYSTFMFAGGGKGDSNVDYELVVAGAILERIAFFHITFGASLETLIDLPARRAEYRSNGLLGNVPP